VSSYGLHLIGRMVMVSLGPKAVGVLLQLDYKTCLECGSPVKEHIVGQAYNKGGLQLINPSELKSMGRKTTAEE